MPGNIFTTKLIEIVVPQQFEKTKNFKDLEHIFLVMDYIDYDLKKMFFSDEPSNFNEKHLLTIWYNILCAIRFLHSTGLMHRDIKPGNILVNEDCVIKLCDFGLARGTIEAPKQQEEFKIMSETGSSPKTADQTPPQLPISKSPYKKKSDGSGQNAASKGKRRLSAHICSRWYRAPEIILN